MAQMQRPRSEDQEGRREPEVSAHESPTAATDVEEAMSPETLGDAQAYNSSMSLPFQTGQSQLGKAGEAQDVGPVSAVYTRREVYLTPGGEVAEQVTEYSTTTTMQVGFDPYYNVAAAAPGYAQINPSVGYAAPGYDQTNPSAGYGAPGYDQLNPSAGYGAPGYDQMNPCAGYGNQVFYGATGGVDYGGQGGVAVNNPAISTDSTAYANVGTTGAAGGESRPAETSTE